MTSRKKGPTPKWTIYEQKLDKKIRNACLSAIFRILSVVVCSAPTDYISLCTFILYGFLGRLATLSVPMSEKILQKITAFVFGNINLHQTFTECVSNYYTHFLID